MAEFIKCLSLAWTGELDSLKEFVKDSLHPDGEWSHPGGDRKVFTFGHSDITWRKNKRLLTASGEKSSEIRKQICEVMLADSVNPCNSTIHESQSCMTTHESIDDIENLKVGQLTNCETIRSLAQSVSHINAVISQLQKRNEDICNNDIRKPEEGSLEHIKQAEHANFIISDDHIISTQLTSSRENNIEEYTPSLKENAFDLSHNENLNINLNASTNDSTHLNCQKPTYANALKLNPASKTALENSSPYNEKCIGNSLPSGSKAKRDSQATAPNNSEEGFIGVERKKRRKHKQFFLSGIAESVNKDQIYSYLSARNITPSNISTFRSKRRSTISAKVSIPLASSSDVLGENFWPKHVSCKPWVQNERKGKPIAQQNIKTLTGNCSTYV